MWYSFGLPFLKQIIFKEVFLKKGNLFQKKLNSKRNWQDSKEKRILQRQNRIILGRREKKVHAELQEWALLDIFTLSRQELTYNI